MTHQECRRNILPEKLPRFDVGLLVQDGDAQIHEGLGKINHLLPTTELVLGLVKIEFLDSLGIAEIRNIFACDGKCGDNAIFGSLFTKCNAN